MNRIGVFICHCGINISNTVDVDKLTEFAAGLNGVIVAKNYKYMCSDVGAQLIKEATREHTLDALIIASCSPRMHEHTFRGVAEESGVNPFKVEIVNIREQCSWVHKEKVQGTEKAASLLKGAVAKAHLLEPLQKSKSAVVHEALVIGAGIAGIQAALDLANDGFKVFLVEKEASIGGRMSQLDKTFPTLDCSSCILTPKMMEVGNHPNIELLTYTEVVSVEGRVGNFKVAVKKKPRYVDMTKCTGCTSCVAACRMKGKVPDEFNMKRGKRSAIYIPFPQAIPLKCTIDPKSCIFLKTGKCGKGPLCVEACEPKAIDFTQKEEIVTLSVGTIIVATGFDLLDPEALYEYGYAKTPNVITTLEFERFVSPSGPSEGHIIVPSTGEPPKSVTYILCVGSRDETQCKWCCRIGCMSALKQVYLIREKLGPEVEINLCYTDIRSFGKGYEEFYRTIRSKGVNFFRGRPSEVRSTKEGLVIDIFDTTTNKLFEIKSDMVVLVPALVPRAGSEEFSRTMNLSRSSDGFFLEAHPKLRPSDTFVNGIFIAGCCQGPKDIADTVAQASAAASKAAAILSAKELENDPMIAAVEPELCAGCGVCVAVCTYKARNMNTITNIAEVDEALCAGCGACIAACPSNASIHKNLTKQQLISMIDEIL